MTAEFHNFWYHNFLINTILSMTEDNFVDKNFGYYVLHRTLIFEMPIVGSFTIILSLEEDFDAT